MHLLFDAPGPPIELKVGVNFAIVAVLYLLLRHRLPAPRPDAAGCQSGGWPNQPRGGRLGPRRRRRRAELRQAEGSAERASTRARQQEILAEVDAEAA